MSQSFAICQSRLTVDSERPKTSAVSTTSSPLKESQFDDLCQLRFLCREPAATSLISARVDPRNQPGNGMLTRDANWSVSLLSLPGRNGLDLGLALSYSSMVWTRSGPYFYFDEDNGFPSPGFRLGFPTVQRKVFDAQTAKNAYLLITPAGQRVELRQVGTSNIYEAGDSSYLQLTETGATCWCARPTARNSASSSINNEYRCTQIKDRNGNYITDQLQCAGPHHQHHRHTRSRHHLQLRQQCESDLDHAGVERAAVASVGEFRLVARATCSTALPTAAVVGTANGTPLPVITQVALNDTSYFTFDYTNSLQVSVIRNYFGAAERNATTFTYETPAGDVPRLTEQ